MQPLFFTPAIGLLRRFVVAGGVLFLATGAPLYSQTNATLTLRSSILSDTDATAAGFPLVADDFAAPLWYDDNDFPGVIRAIGDLQDDIARVTGREPGSSARKPAVDQAVIVGTIGKNAVIDALIAAQRIDGSALQGKRESFVIATVSNPAPGLAKALVIAGSDKRGAIYGVYELSRQIGVSPWYFWADAPIAHRDTLIIAPGAFHSGEPKVKYRGIFINDEAPALRRWVEDNFGGFNPEFYAHVFELILRSKGNYLWPAMWLPVSFNDDDSNNPRLADEYGVIVSTSHHEPMMRAHHEWERYGSGPWNYETNAENLREFWRGGVERIRDYESVITVGMRGDGDEAMSEDTAVPLLKEIIADQRAILSDVFDRPAAQIPQVWALYKEVQDYYDKGMRVDDDILVLFSDDNWGNIRYLPRPEDRDHPGGYGMYYHVDYVGAPVSYRWLNVSQIERIWEQMTLAYTAGVQDLWILNVGDIKPMELPMSFFLDLAWDREAVTAADLPAYYVDWATQQFGPQHAVGIADLLALYTKYNARRTPEMLTPTTYSVAHYREADRIVEEYTQLADRARALADRLPADHQAAYYQLVQFPIEACANLNAMYVAAGKNLLYAERGTSQANFFADEVRRHFDHDAELTRRFHEDLLDGKWNHMMAQTHIGYTYWQHPPLNRMPAVSYVQLPEAAELGFFVEYGERPRWGWLDVEADWSFTHDLPTFDPVNDQDYFIEVFNRGRAPLSYTLAPQQDWIRLSRRSGTIQFGERIHVTIDWTRAPAGRHTGRILLSGAGSEYTINVPIRHERPTDLAGFIANNGVVSFEATAFDRTTPAGNADWIIVPNLGRTGSAVTVTPADATRREPGEDSPLLEYTFSLLEPADAVTLHTYLSPTLNFPNGEGLQFAVAIDDEAPHVINMNEGEERPDWTYAPWWMQVAGDRIRIKRSDHGGLAPGPHTLKVWMVDPGVVIQKFVLDLGDLQPSYLGPPASHRISPATSSARDLR